MPKPYKNLTYSQLSVLNPIELAEADGSSSGKFDVLMIRPGLSLNNVFYSESLLRGAVDSGLFEGVRSLARSDSDHFFGDGKKAQDVVGIFSNTRYVEGTGVVGTLSTTPDAEWLSEKLRFAIDNDKPDLLGFSIVGEGIARRDMIDGQSVRVVENLTAINFTDVVVDPGAGGQVLSVVSEASVYAGALRDYFKSQDGQQDWDDEYQDVIEAGLAGERESEVIALAESAGVNRNDALTYMARHIDPYTGENMLREALLNIIKSKRPDVYKTINIDTVTEATLQEMVNNLIETPAPVPDTPTASATTTTTETASVDGLSEALSNLTTMQTKLSETMARMDQREARITLSETLQTSGLPVPAQAAVRQLVDLDISEGRVPTPDRITQFIESQKSVITGLGQAGIIENEGQTYRVELGEASVDKAATRLENFFDGFKDGSYSFREAYIELTGDQRCSGKWDRHKLSQLSAYAESKQLVSLSETVNLAALDLILADTLNRRMVAEYERVDLGMWRQVVSRMPVPDFRTQHRTRFGGYDNLDIVAESGPYTAIATPTDEEATYAVNKRGNTETLTWEAIRNDDIAFISQIPIRLGRAAQQTLHEFVFDFFRTNPTIYDATAYFTVGHGNLLTAAFSQTQYMVVRQAMRAQTELDSGKPLSILPNILMGPADLEDAMFDAFTRNLRNDDNLALSVKPTILILDYWTDANDWVVLSGPTRNPGIEIGFLDGEEPRIFVQDSPTVGSWFDTDERTFKIQHVYGGAVTDFRSAHKSVVA
ncbi:MAG: Mu-like prophage major head subunit gpT family protein [Gammaproteobacteria bacterium]|nr:Mu-like prophage major head subunit gpT family protein [Gammaproteobacteria bacterium]